MSRQYWVTPLPPFHTADGPTITAAALADASPTPNIVIPGNTLEVGSRLEFNAFGRVSTPASTPGTAVVGIYFSPSAAAIAVGHAVVVSAALTMTVSVTTRTFRIEGNASVRTVGTTGTVIGSLELTGITGAAGSFVTDLVPATSPATSTVDTTLAQTVRLGLTPSVATQSWIIHYFGVRLVN